MKLCLAVGKTNKEKGTLHECHDGMAELPVAHVAPRENYGANWWLKFTIVCTRLASSP